MKPNATRRCCSALSFVIPVEALIDHHPCNKGGSAASERILADLIVSVEAEHGEERLVDCPHLRGGEPSNSTAQALHVDRAQLLNEHASCSARNLDLWTERRRPSAARRRSNDHYGARKQRIRLPTNP